MHTRVFNCNVDFPIAHPTRNENRCLRAQYKRCARVPRCCEDGQDPRQRASYRRQKMGCCTVVDGKKYGMHSRFDLPTLCLSHPLFLALSLDAPSHALYLALSLARSRSYSLAHSLSLRDVWRVASSYTMRHKKQQRIVSRSSCHGNTVLQ